MKYFNRRPRINRRRYTAVYMMTSERDVITIEQYVNMIIFLFFICSIGWSVCRVVQLSNSDFSRLNLCWIYKISENSELDTISSLKLRNKDFPKLYHRFMKSCAAQNCTFEKCWPVIGLKASRDTSRLGE